MLCNAVKKSLKNWIVFSMLLLKKLWTLKKTKKHTKHTKTPT